MTETKVRYALPYSSVWAFEHSDPAIFHQWMWRLHRRFAARIVEQTNTSARVKIVYNSSGIGNVFSDITPILDRMIERLQAPSLRYEMESARLHFNEAALECECE